MKISDVFVLKSSLTAISLCAAALFFSEPALAQSALRYETIQTHLDSQPAQLRIIADDNLKDIQVSISNCGPKTVTQKFAALAAGQSETVTWTQPAGRYSCRVSIAGKSVLRGAVQIHDTQEFISTSALLLSIDLRSLTPETSSIDLHANRPFVNAEVKITGEDGNLIDSVSKPADGKADLRVEWKPGTSAPALIEIRIEDQSGAWASSTIVYFKIPHTDIVFDTGKHSVRQDQEVHLQETLGRITDIIGRLTNVAADLYITGHTDTVGSEASNLKLSLNRARSIAQWFRSHGLKIPMYYRGAGEKGLAVNTPDETPNAQNRRAVYILTNRPPIEQTELGSYKKLD